MVDKGRTADDNDNEKTSITTEQVNELLNLVLNFCDTKGFNFSGQYLTEHLKVLIDYIDRLKQGLSSPEGILSISQLEEMMLDLFRKQRELNLVEFLSELRNIQGEKAVIEKKKEEYLQKGIKLRNYQRYTTSVVTLMGRINYTRMALIPSTPADKLKLKHVNCDGYVYPIDEALGLAHLPFKITVPTMLEVAYTAATRYSYEEAEKDLSNRSNIIVNDDTIRKVTNEIGSLVFNNDTKIADEIWEHSAPWKFTGSKKKYNSTLYLQVDGAMVNMRSEKVEPEIDNNMEFEEQEDLEVEEGADEKRKKGWKENKLGMAFSANDILYWTDKHGKRQHRILKREYVSLIGSYKIFSKYFYSLAVRNGLGVHKNIVLLTDGAKWIKEMRNQLFGEIQHILDFFHLAENISKFAKNIFPNDDEKSGKWSKTIRDLFKKNGYIEAINEIKSLGKKVINKSKFDLLRYIEENIDCINYPEYLSKGYFIGSGAIESANRTVLQRRLKQPGMRWNMISAQSMVTLMSKERSSRWLIDVEKPTYEFYGITNSPAFQRSLLGTY
jgi:hypothetical protein